MGSVSVSKESLRKIKIELGNFQTSMDSTTEHMKAHAEEAVVEVRNSIKKQQALVVDLENTVAKLAEEIEERQTQIISNNNKINSLANNISAGRAQSSGLDQRIAQLRARKQQLMSLCSADSNNNGNDNSSQINAIDNQIRECENQRRRLNEQIATMQSQQNDLNHQNNLLREEKARIEAELSTTKGELNKAREKNDKMKAAGAAVESKINDLLGVVRHFRQSVTTKTSTSKSGIEKCIAAIVEYEAVQLASGHGAVLSESSMVNSQNSSGQRQNESASPMLERTLFELSVLRDDLSLGTGDADFPQIGGIYGDMETLSGFERHHIPSNAVQNDDADNLPAILISCEDHAMTDSFRGRQRHRHRSFLPDVPRSESYRNEIASEIDAGYYIDVVRNEIYNIIDTCGHRYDGAIGQYLDALEEYLRQNGVPQAVYSNLRQGGN